jgi:heptosyltransferase-2
MVKNTSRNNFYTKKSRNKKAICFVENDKNLKILIIQQKMIGDVLTSSILCERIRQEYPLAEIHYLINSHTKPVLENNPFVDKLVLFTPEIEKSKIEFYRFLKKIQIEKYNIAIDVYGKLSSTLISIFTKAEIKISYFKKHTSPFYTHTFKRIKKPIHQCSLAIENRLKLLELIDIPFQAVMPKIYLKDTEVSSAKNMLESAGIVLKKPLFMVSILGSNPIKTYPPIYLATLLDEILKIIPEAQFLLNYIPKQISEVEKIIKLCKEETQQQIYFKVFGRSLREFLALTHHCNAMIGNEGGANNMAKALEIPTFSIFSPYLNKLNWFGENETKMHVAVHLDDYLKYDKKLAKKNPAIYYQKMKPDLLLSKLKEFLLSLD